MTEHRRFPAEVLVQQHVLRHRTDPVLAAQDVRDAHQVIVDDHGHVIRRIAVRLDQHLHVDLRIRNFDFAAQHVGEATDALVRNFHANDVRLTGRNTPFGGCRSSDETTSVVARVFTARGLLGAKLIQSFRRAEAIERMTGVEQTRCVLLDRSPCRSLCRYDAAAAADVGTFVPIESEPSQRIDDHAFRRARAARNVGVFDAENELAALTAREDLIDQRDIGGADMRIARRRRRHSGANGHARDSA